MVSVHGVSNLEDGLRARVIAYDPKAALYVVKDATGQVGAPSYHCDGAPSLCGGWAGLGWAGLVGRCMWRMAWLVASAPHGTHTGLWGHRSTAS